MNWDGYNTQEMYIFLSVDPKELEDVKESLKNEDNKIKMIGSAPLSRFNNYSNKNAVLEEMRYDLADGIIDNKYRKYFSELDYLAGTLNIDYIKNIYKEEGIENVDKLYYRMGASYRYVDSTDILDDSKRYYRNSNTYIAYESVIKSVDL